MSDEQFRRLDALLATGLRLAETTPSGRILLARVSRAIDPDWIPRPWGSELVQALTRARAAAPQPVDEKHVRRLLERAWGAKPEDELDRFESSPVAVTPTAQVHRGELEGAPVAIKVLRPGVASSIRQDLTVLEALLSPLGAAFPALDARAVLHEFRERVLDELDLEHEASVQRRFHRALRRHPFLRVPQPITRLAHEHVLVSEWVDGVPLSQAPDRDAAAARLVLFALGAGRAGLVHAGLTPEDVLVDADGRLVVLDFGASAVIEPARVELMASVVDAFADDDQAGFAHALSRLGALDAEHAPTALELTRHALGELADGRPARLDGAAVAAVRDRVLERPGELATLIANGSMPPEDLWPARGTAQLFATIARVGATAPWRDQVRAALRTGWRA